MEKELEPTPLTAASFGLGRPWRRDRLHLLHDFLITSARTLQRGRAPELREVACLADKGEDRRIFRECFGGAPAMKRGVERPSNRFDPEIIPASRAYAGPG